jgi:hypothetical protein
MSSMLPYLFFFMPLALVAIQPPSVDSSTLSGSCPEVHPAAASSRSSFFPEIPASTTARRLTESISRMRSMRRMSTDTTIRCSAGGHASAPLTLVPPPYGITHTTCSWASRIVRTSASLRG